VVISSPLFLSSGDLLADRRYEWAKACLARGDLADAAGLLVQAIELSPGFASAWFALGEVRVQQGARDAASEAFLKALDADPQDRHGAALQLARLGTGGATPPASPAYLRTLFDQYAPDFDRALLEGLEYRAPTLLLAAVMKACRATGRSARFSLMLDLGCGTGLAGAAFRSISDKSTGVDLSPGMLELARAKGVYWRLENADLLAFLASEAATASRYDIIVAADVLVYVASLQPIMRTVAPVLAADGLFAFTVEAHSGPDAVLTKALRYAHGIEHVRAALGEAGLVPVEFGEGSTRTEKGLPVPSLVVVARHSKR
jgi:predicted TPR repeat methyltransferase